MKIKTLVSIYIMLLGTLLLAECSKEIASPTNSPPYISRLPIQVSRVGEPFQAVELDAFVEDEDPDSLISWSLIPGAHIGGSVDQRVLSLSPIDSVWSGTDIISLRAIDTEGLSSQIAVTCQVVDMDAWEIRHPDGTITITWTTPSSAEAAVKYGSSPTYLYTEASSLLESNTLHQVRLLGIASDQIIYYQAVNYDPYGAAIFESPVDSFMTALVQPNDVLRVSMIDVRQGDSFLMTTPNDQVMVIDGGYGTYQPSWGGAWSGDGYPFALNYLQEQGIDHVDYMVETHHDMDHWGGLRDIQNAMTVTNYYSPESPGPLAPGQPWVINEPLLDVMVLSVDYPPGVPRSGDNNRSIVMRFEIGQVSFLFTGDSEREVELWEVASYGSELQSTILKVAHHGSSSSSDPSFMNLVHPEIALITCGAGNPYGHPHSETLETLNNVGAEIYRTDLDGNVTIRTDGQTTLEITR